jgi:hypothetical protein
MTRKRSTEELRQLSRMAGLMSAAQATPEERSDRGRRSVQSQITKKVDPDGTLQQRNPHEFAIKYDLTMKAHMAMMAAAHTRKAEERRAAKIAKYGEFVLVRACPMCNEEIGKPIPTGYLVEPCIYHWFAAKRAAFGALLDSAAEVAAAAIAS